MYHWCYTGSHKLSEKVTTCFELAFSICQTFWLTNRCNSYFFQTGPLQHACSPETKETVWNWGSPAIFFCIWCYQSHFRISSPLLYDVASVHWGLQAFVNVQLSLGPTTSFQSGWALDLDWTIATPGFYSFSVTLLYICCCVWDHCPVAWPSFSQVVAVRQMASHLTLEYLYIHHTL